jgi:Phage Tail Protein X
MSDYLLHTTGVNDRWDLIAYRYYGDQHRIAPIIKANRNLFEADLSPIPDILPPKMILKVPILAKNNKSLSLLPPWKR